MERLTLEELKPIIQDKWLDYYEANQWIIDKVYDRGYHRSNNHQAKGLRAEFILCTVVVLEPKLQEFLSYFWLVCNDWDKIVSVLGLSFNPSQALKNRKEKNCKHE